MTANAISRRALPLAISDWWRALGRAHKLSGAVSIVVVCATAYACSIVGRHIEELSGNKAAASTALYMDAFVEPLVQELASRSAISSENRVTLERLLSPASMGKPIVAFRIWVDDRIVFSNRGDLVGKRFPSTAARVSAFKGDVVASFGLEGDDDDDERALSVPILEIYAPIRQTGTNRIIAVAETSELAVELIRETRTAQHTSYVVLGSTALGLLLGLYNLTGRLQSQIGELTRQRANNQQFKSQIYTANRRVLEISERKLRHVGEELYAGPLQLVAFARLRLDTLSKDPAHLDTEIAVVNDALNECMSQIRSVSVGLTPSDLAPLSVSKVISTAICLHEARTGSKVTCEFRSLPKDATFVLKSCLYHFIEHALGHIFQHTVGANVHACARREDDMLEIELTYPAQPSLSWLAEDLGEGDANLRHRIEALGGGLRGRSHGDRDASIIASFWIGDRDGSDE